MSRHIEKLNKPIDETLSDIESRLIARSPAMQLAMAVVQEYLREHNYGCVLLNHNGGASFHLESADELLGKMRH